MLRGQSFLSCIFAWSAVVGCAQAAGQGAPTVNKIGEDEEKILRSADVEVDNASLLAYVKARTLKDEDRTRIEKLIQDLDSDRYNVREKATKELKLLGRNTIPFLKKALKSAPLEVVRRAGRCIEEISTQNSTEPIAEVARLLALRGTTGAAEVLLNYVPFVDDPFLEEEILTSLGRLTVHHDRIDPVLIAALNGAQLEKRAAAVYVIAQCGDASLRSVVRQLLNSEDSTAQAYAASGLLGKRTLEQMRENLHNDLAVLSNAKIDAEGTALIAHLDKLSLGDKDRLRVQDLVQQLGDKLWARREKATRALMAEQSRALPFLKTAVDDADVERATRAASCMNAILKREKADPVPTAVTHLLALAGERHAAGHLLISKEDLRTLKPAAAITALLRFVPFVQDDVLEEEVMTSLAVLCVREPAVPTAVVAALEDPLPARGGRPRPGQGRYG
jgi:hypothetical protein